MLIKPTGSLKKSRLVQVCTLALSLSQIGHADLILDFFKVPSTTGIDLSSQFEVSVSADDSGVLFTFKNKGPDGTIGTIMFDDGLLSPSIFMPALSHGTVDFLPKEGGTLGVANSVGFDSSKDLDSRWDINVKYGIDSGEWATIKFDWNENFPTLNDVEVALTDYSLNDKGYLEPSLWVGMHVQRELGDNSDTYVHKARLPGTPVPDNGTTMAMLGLGIVVLGYIAGRKS